jgi:hypothetical protein
MSIFLYYSLIPNFQMSLSTYAIEPLAFSSEVWLKVCVGQRDESGSAHVIWNESETTQCLLPHHQPARFSLPPLQPL